MINSIKQLKDDGLYDKVVELHKNIVAQYKIGQNILNVTEKVLSVYSQLLNDVPTMVVSKSYSISTARCIDIGMILTKRYKQMLLYADTDNIINLRLANRTYNALSRAGFKNIRELTEYYNKHNSFNGIRNLGVIGQQELIYALFNNNRM